MSPRNTIIVYLILVIFLFTIVIPTPMAGAENGPNGCDQRGCHGSSFYQYFNILPDHEDSAIPDTMEEGESYRMPLVLENECSHSQRKYSSFERTEITFTFDSDSITATPSVVRAGELLRGTRIFYVTLKCHKVEPVMVTIDAVGYNPHENVASTDSYTFSINSVIRLSRYTIDPGEGNTSIQLVPSENVDRVEINPSTSLEGLTNITPMVLENLSEGIPVDISLGLLDPTVQGFIHFTWWAGNRTGTVVLTAAIPPGSPEVKGQGLFVLIGRITGILSFILLVISTVLCLNIKSWKRFTLRKLGKKRLLLHCYVSYGIVATSLVHLGVLMAGEKYSSLFEYGIFMTGSNWFYYNIGHIALVVMILLGLTGMFQKRMLTYFKKRGYIPYATWRLLHLTLTVLAFLLVLVHMIKIGSDFDWLR
jgi:hypothetical protein